MLIMNIKYLILILLISITKSNDLNIYCTNDEMKISSLELYISKNEKKNGNIYDIFKNPYGKYFEIITVTEANLKCDNIFHREDSFYEGYLWSICVCPKCGKHQGWLFIPDIEYCNLFPSDNCKNRKHFYGIITDNLKPKKVNYYEEILL
jgi:hypothetical protein